MTGKLRIDCGVIALAMFFAICALAHGGEWDRTVEISGRGFKQSGFFPLVGSKWRVRYASKSTAGAKVEIVARDGKVVATVVNHRRLETPYSTGGKISPAMGEAYLRVSGDANGWTCQLEQYTDEISGWKLFRWRKDAQAAKTEKFAMWAGEAGDETEIPVTIESDAVLVEFATYESGRVKIRIDDAEGQCHYMDCHLAAGKSRSWIYRPGEYVIRVSSVGSPWSVALDTDRAAAGVAEMPGLEAQRGK